MKKYLLLFIPLLFLNCTTISLREVVQIQQDQFEPNITVLGIETQIGGHDRSTSFLRSWINKETKKTVHQVYVYHHYFGDWHFYNNAYAAGGESLPFISIDRDVSCTQYLCSYTEIFGATITDEFLKDNINGFSIKMTSKSGNSIIVYISEYQVMKQIEAINPFL